jgi:hypothetical protein
VWPIGAAGWAGDGGRWEARPQKKSFDRKDDEARSNQRYAYGPCGSVYPGCSVAVVVVKIMPCLWARLHANPARPAAGRGWPGMARASAALLPARVAGVPATAEAKPRRSPQANFVHARGAAPTPALHGRRDPILRYKPHCITLEGLAPCIHATLCASANAFVGPGLPFRLPDRAVRRRTQGRRKILLNTKAPA